MKKIIRNLIFAATLLIANGFFSQGTYTSPNLTWTTGWCNICGPTTGNYACNPPWSGSGTWNNGMRTFVTAIPAGQVVTNVCVQVNKVNCGYTNLCVNINGVLINCAPPTPAGNCGCGTCWPETYCATFPCPTGLPGFINNGTNTVQLVQSGGDICVNYAVVTLTYAMCCQVPTITAVANPTAICLGKTSTLTASGAGIGGTYTWQPGGMTGSAVVVSPAATTIYTVSGTTSLNCTGTRTVQLVVNPSPTLTPNSNSPICAGGTLSLTTNAQSSYTWTGPGAWLSNLQNPTRTPVVAGAYTLIATSALGCTAQAIVNVNVTPNPTATAANNGPICRGTNLVLNGGGGGTYSWTGPNGFTSPGQIPIIANAQPSISGVYSLVVTVNGCTNMATTTVVVNPAPTPTATSNSPVCLNKPINLMGLGGVTYTWTGPFGYTSNQQNPIIASAQFTNSGTYTLSVTNGFGCTATTTVAVVVNPLPVPIVNNPTVCLNQPINLTANGGTAYAWSGPLGYTSGVQNPTILNAQLNMSGGYSVIVTSAAGCTAQAVANVTVIALPQPSITSNSPVCTGNVLNLIGSGGTTYTWSGPNGFASNLQSPFIANVPLAANGIYSLVVSVGTCTNIVTASITINPLPTPTAQSNSPVCLNKPINLIGLGGTTYTWTGPFGFISNQQSPIIASAQFTNAGTYTLTVTNANGCVNSTTTNVIVNPLPVPIVNNPVVCLNQPINLTASGGTAYAWSGPLGYTSAVQNPTILNAQLNMSGGYSVVVTSAAGCTAQAVANVTVITLPQPTITSSSPNCVGSTLTFTGGGGATYNWSGPNGFASFLQNPSIANVQMNANGIYTLIVTAGTCSNVTTASITINPLPTPTAISNSPVCLLQPINFTGNGGTTYTWTGPGGYTSNQQNPIIAVAQNSNAGVYTLSVTNANGCVNFTTTNVVINPLPIIPVTNLTVCMNQPINLTSGGGVTYTWTGPSGFTSNLQNPIIASAQATNSGAYTVVVSSAAGCTAQAVNNVTVLALPVASITSNAPVCFGSTLSFTGSGGALYNWSGPNGFASLLQNPSIPNVPLAANGIYTLMVTAGTCSNTTTASITINPLPTPTAISNSPVCLLQPIVFGGLGGVTYTWTGPGLNSTVQNPTIAVAQNTNAGTYTLTVTNANGCVNTTTTAVLINPLPVIVVNNPTTCVNTNINLTSTGGVNYNWSGPLGYTSNLQNPVIPGAQVNMSGAYTVTVISAPGCSNTAVANVSVVALPQPTAASNGPKCVGQNLQLLGSGGQTFSWTGPNGFFNASQNPVIVNVQLAAGGVYTLVSTANTCTNVTTVNVVINPLPTPNIISNSPVCLNQPILLSASGGTVYNWVGPNGYTSGVQNPTIAVAQNTNAGTYTLTVTDANVCTNTTVANVVINPLPAVSANGAAACLNTPINLSAFGAALYNWSGPLGFTSNQQNPVIPVATMSNAGQYTVIGTSAAGCTAQTVANVTVIPLPNASITAVDPCIGSNLTLTGNGGTGYNWSGPNGFSSQSPNPTIMNVTLAESGIYSLTVTVGPCSGIASQSITVHPLPTPTLGSNSPICMKEQIQLFGSGGNSYSWVGPNNYSGSGTSVILLNASNSHQGTYTATATDIFGCVNTATIAIVINPLPIIGTKGSTLCATRTITLTVGGANSYVWNGPLGYTSTNSTVIINNAQPDMSGDYTVTATDLNGCKITGTAHASVMPTPAIVVSANTPVCANNTLQLTANAPTGNTYFWSGPGNFLTTQQNPKVQDTDQSAHGEYTVQVTDAIGCTGTAVVMVVVKPAPQIGISSDKLEGCVPLCINLSPSNINDLSKIVWEYGDGNVTTGMNASTCYNKPGSYFVKATYTDKTGCSNKSNLAVQAWPIPVADFNFAPTKPVVNEAIEFMDASSEANIAQWTWNFSHLKNQTMFKPNLTMIYENPGSYAAALMVVSDHGCKDTVVKEVIVGEDFAIYVPDAFTPNGDGHNDIFQPKGVGITKFEMNIFDRWGERVFTTNDMEVGWDGTFPRRTNEELKQDVYVWQIKLVSVRGGKEKELSGKVTLLK